jgi:hypothetical protein
MVASVVEIVAGVDVPNYKKLVLRLEGLRYDQDLDVDAAVDSLNDAKCALADTEDLIAVLESNRPYASQEEKDIAAKKALKKLEEYEGIY